MKRLIILVGIVLFPLFSFGMCMESPEPTIWPESGKIPQNPVFIIRGGNFEWGISSNLYISSNVLKYETYLVSQNGDTISLRIKRNYNNYEQVFFQPFTELEKNHTYTLHTPYMDFGELHYFKSTYTTTDFKDTVAPKWQEQPFLTETVYEQLGCGDDKFAIFSSKINDQSKCIVFVRIFEEKSQRTFSYYLPHDKGSFDVGKYMCGCAYYFNDSDYRIEFGLMDAAGNVSEKITDTCYLNGNFSSKTYTLQNKVKSDEYYIENMKIIAFMFGGIFLVVLLLGLRKRSFLKAKIQKKLSNIKALRIVKKSC